MMAWAQLADQYSDHCLIQHEASILSFQAAVLFMKENKQSLSNPESVLDATATWTAQTYDPRSQSLNRQIVRLHRDIAQKMQHIGSINVYLHTMLSW